MHRTHRTSIADVERGGWGGAADPDQPNACAAERSSGRTVTSGAPARRRGAWVAIVGARRHARGVSHLPFRLVVFDWDGTLVDSAAKIVGCFEAAIAALGWAPRPQTALRGVIGLGLPQTVPVLFPGVEEDAIEAFVAAYRQAWLAPDAPRSAMFTGARDLLHELRDAGYRLAVATGKSRAGLARELVETGTGALFEATRCADETRSKPHPAMLEALLDATGTPPEAALVVGDTTYDLDMARAAGVAAVGVSWGVHAPEQLHACGPLSVFDTIGALQEWFTASRAAE